MRMKTQVLIIGGGITGVGLARDLALRGISCVLAERRDINAGASGANHGLLHSGARYVRNDPLAAVECREESALLKKLAPQCIEPTGGMFVAVAGDDANYAADFPNSCHACGISVKAVDVRDAREMEPVLSDKLIAAYLVEDASIDPFRLSLENISQAVDLGGTLLLHTSVVGFATGRGRIRSVRLLNNKSGRVSEVEADVVVNAAGAWTKDVAALAGVDIDLMYSKGSLLITDTRINRRVINRLRLASDADILVPGGTVSILGTTSVRLDSLEDIRPTVDEMDYIVGTAAAMVPCLETVRYIRAYAGVRPLAGSKALDDDRALSRGFTLLDHARDGLENFVSIVGGKLTTYRRMAEKTADLVCERLGVDRPCLTGIQPLPTCTECEWTTPGLAPKRWLGRQEYDDLLLCECEMVPQSVIETVIESIRARQTPPDLYGIGRRSRVGKGTCQGAFCGTRILAFMYDRGDLEADQGLQDLKIFLRSRWKGMRPILWDAALAQEELQEALHCGLFGLELNP